MLKIWHTHLFTVNTRHPTIALFTHASLFVESIDDTLLLRDLGVVFLIELLLHLGLGSPVPDLVEQLLLDLDGKCSVVDGRRRGNNDLVPAGFGYVLSWQSA